MSMCSRGYCDGQGFMTVLFSTKLTSNALCVFSVFDEIDDGQLTKSEFFLNLLNGSQLLEAVQMLQEGGFHPRTDVHPLK